MEGVPLLLLVTVAALLVLSWVRRPDDVQVSGGHLVDREDDADNPLRALLGT
jgi:hypothetical protein